MARKMHAIQALDAIDVLQRARQLIAGNRLPNVRPGDGAYCPWCAIAQAKSKLDEEYHTTGDGPLEMARIWLGNACSDLTQDDALACIDHALELAQ